MSNLYASVSKPIRVKVTPWQALALLTPIEHFAMLGGVATGKTFTGAQFSISHFLNFPKLTGFIGANTYDQLSMATLRELFYWLEEYRIEYVIDRFPPTMWGNVPRKFKSYKNVLSIRHPRLNIPVHAFTRVLSDPDALRGIEFSWYHLDETRETPENTHDILIARMRESDYRKGLITSTTNGEDWAYKRFVLGGDRIKYGSLHVATIEAVRLGIISQDYYDTMLRSYSELFAAQELWARHVNVRGGRAYYTAGEHNKRGAAPWGQLYPDVDRPLVIGCDFNFSPAPHCWMVGQVGPHLYNSQGRLWSEHIHWFGELVMDEASTPHMTEALLNRFPGFSFYEFYGDASGGRGTTSNAGEHDYEQISNVCEDAGVPFTVDYDQSNPLVRDRVENMNGLFKNALGEVRQTYDPQRCPSFDADMRFVGWKKTQTGAGKLDDGGDNQRTHCSDGAGYACFKKFPPGQRGYVPRALSSPHLVGVSLDNQA